MEKTKFKIEKNFFSPKTLLYFVDTNRAKQHNKILEVSHICML